MKTVVASGYFDPLHIGHIEYLKKSKELGDRLIVLVNTNQSAVQKKGFYFMELQERIKIIQSLKYVDEAIPALDEDGTVAKSLSVLKPDIFAKGGDRTISNLPKQEIEVCRQNNIEIITQLGGKIQSSSQLVNDSIVNQTIREKWGQLRTIYNDSNMQIKLLYIDPHSSVDLQRHLDRNEIWITINGYACIENDNRKSMFCKGETLPIIKECTHRVSNVTDDVLIIQETQIVT